MAKVKAGVRGRGWYLFADGTREWFYGLSAAEKRWAISQHGAVIRYEPTV